MKKKYQSGSPVSLDPTTNLPQKDNTGINWQIKKENPFKRINTVGKQSLSTSGVTTRGDIDRYSRLQRPFKLDEPSLSKHQAQAQPWTDQLGNWAVQTLQGEILGGTMQGFGAIYEAGDNLVRWGLRKGGIDVEPGDFSNKFMEWGTDLQKSARDKFPIYLENPNQAWSMSDPGWWFSNGVSIASSLSLMIPGMAVTKGIGYLAKTAGKTMPFWAQVGTNAVVMRNGENYREGLDVVNRTRSDAMDQFLNMGDEEWNLLSNSKLAQQLKSEGKWSTDEYSNKKALADRIAGAAGFESYKVNSTNIVFDIVQSALAVRAFSGMAGRGRLRSPKPKVVEANATAAGRELTSKQLRAAYANYYLNPANSLVAGSLTEYPEEVINFIGTEEGMRKGRVLMGKEREEATTRGSRISKYLKDPHAHEAGFFGVFGGGIYQKASQGAGTLINNYKGRKNPYSPDSKIAEIEGRAIKMGDTSARMQAVAAKENHPVYGDFSNLTDEQAEAIVNDLRQDLGRELGITSAAHGNEKLLKKMVNMPEYKQLLIDNGIVSEEDIDAYLPVLNENIDQGVRDYYAARKRAQKHNLGLKGYSKLLNEDLMVAGLLQKRLKQSSDVASKINELKTGAQYSDQGYKFLLNKGTNQADLDLALQLEGAKKALSYFQFEQENLQSTIEELDSKVVDHLADKVGRARARVQELTEQAEGKELPSLNEVSDELRELHRDQEVFNAEGSQLAQMLGKMHKPENVQQAEEQREEEDKQKTADRTKRLRDEVKTNVRNPQRIKEEIERIESLRAAYEDLPGGNKIIDEAIDKLNNRLKTQEAKKAAKEAEANPTQENEEVRRQNVNKVESPAETNEETANSTEQNEKVNDDAFVNLDINEMLAKEAQTTIEGSTRVFIPELVTKDDRDNTISETSVEAKLLSNKIKVGDQIEIFIQPSNRVGLNEGEQFTADNLPLAIRVNDVVIGYVNTISGKQNNIEALQARLDAIPNNYEDNAQFSNEAIENFETQKHNLNEQLTKIGKELEAVRKMREAAFAVYNPDLDQLAIAEQPVFNSTITEKTSGALITLDVPQSITYGAINDAGLFIKLEDTPLYYHDGANKYVITKVDNPNIEFTREGETSFYNADMGYTKGGFYLLLESPSGQQIPTRLTTRKINSEEIQRAAEILNELKQLVQSAGTMSVKTTPRIGELKDELNRITYVGKGGIELHNDRIDINISHGKKRYTAKLYFYGAPNTAQAGQALENFNISFLDSEGNQVRESLFNENAAAVNQAISNILVNSYKSVVVKDLQGENAEQYYKDLLDSDTFLTDVGKVKSENGNFISHFAAEGSGFKMQVGIDTKVTPVGKTKAPKQESEEIDKLAKLEEAQRAFRGVKGENISSRGSSFAKKLTNPGNNLKVTYKGTEFRNAEHAYQTYKSGEFDQKAYDSTAFKPVGSKPANKNTNYQTMVDILKAKLEQHPELIEGINERGGLAYIEQSTHNVTGDKFWESKGQNKFIEALADAYKSIQPTQQIGKVEDSIAIINEYTNSEIESIIRNSEKAEDFLGKLLSKTEQKVEGGRAEQEVYEYGTIQRIFANDGSKAQRLIDNSGRVRGIPLINLTMDAVEAGLLFDGKKGFTLTEKQITEFFNSKFSKPSIQQGEQTSLDFDTQDDDLFTSAVVPEDTPSAKIKIDEAKAWLKENLPQVPLEVVEGLIETGGGYAWGTFHKGAIQLSDIAKEGTEYHDAFHAVEHMYLNPIQRERIYKEARTVYGESLSDREIGEELAEEYREYQMMNGTSTFRLPTAIERFFGDIFRYIKHFISNGRSRTYTERLFKDISGGRFTNQPDQRAMDWAKSQDMIPRIAGLSRKEQKQAIDVITSLAHAIRERLVARGEQSNAKVIYSRIKAGLKRNMAGKTIEQQDGINRVVDALGRKMKDSELWDKVSLRIQKDLNVVVKIDDTSISEEEKILAKQNWDDTANFEENHKDKTSAKIKLAIRTTKEVADYKNGKVVLKSDNFMGMANFLDFNKVYPYLEKNLIGIRDPQHLLDRLTEMGKHDMSLLSLRDKIKNYKNSKGKNTLLAAFYHHFDKAAPNFTVNLLSRDNDTGMMVNQEFFSNNNNAYQNLAEGWQGIIEYKIENEQYDSSELEKKARQSRIAIQKMQKEGTFTPKSAADMISGMLSDIGITTFEQGQDVVSKALENAFVKEPAKAREVIKKYERIVANLKDNVFDNVGDLNFIGELVAPYKYDIIQNSAQTIDGKIYYGITKPNFMSDFYKKLQDPVVGPQIVDQLLKNPRTNESTIVKRMVEYKEGNVVRDNQNLPVLNNAFVSSLGYSPQDGIKELGQREGLKYKAIQDVDWHSLNLLKFFDTNVNTVPNGFYASHLPIPSDSGQLYYVKVPKLTAQFGEGNVLLKTSQVYRAIQQQIRAEKAAMKQAKDLLFDVVDGELSLKSLDQIYAKDSVNQNRLIEHYHYKYNKAGEKVFLENGVPTGNVFKFYFLPAMNEDNGVLRTNGVINEYLAEDAVAFEDSVIQNYVQDLANNMPLDFLDALNSIEVPRIDGDATQSALTFLLNELVANEEMYNLFAGGQAFYKSATDLNKRMKQLISPGEKQSRMFTGETYKNGVIEDVIKPSAIIENKIDGLENWLKNYGGMRKNAKVNKENIINKKPSNDIEKEIYGILENYLNIDTADGQGIVTVDRYLAQMEDIGRESDDLYKVVDAIKAGKELNRRDLKAILQPLKGFMYSNEYDSYLGMFVPRQIKYSTGVLVPQLVEGTEFDKIRKWMDSEKGTDELIFHSASKVGSRHVQKIHDDNGNIIEEALDQIHIEHISNDRWQKQLDIPDHVEDTTNTLGSQIAKLIMNNLSPNRIYTLAGDIAGEQRKFTGPELVEYYNQMLSENIIESHDKLMNRLDANESRTGFNNLLKVQDILQQELDRQESSEGMYEFINVDNKDNSKFEIPLAFGPNASKFESILTSLFTKNVTKQRFPGGTAVNFSSTFFKNAEVEETNELKMNVYESNDVKIIEAEAILPAWSEKFYRDGKLMDINQIPEELRTLITYRIPSAGKKAIIVVKAKAFSPKEMGNIIMLPNDFIVQSGMDFDIDKVNFMHKSFYVNNNDRFVIPKYGKIDQSTLEEDVSTDSRNNEIFDIYLSILTNPAHYAEIISPEAFADVTKAKENIQKVTGENDENIISGAYFDQNKLRKRNIAAKDLVGIAANYNQFTALSQIGQLRLIDDLGIKVKYPASKYKLSQLKARFGEAVKEGNNIIVTHKLINHTADGSQLNAEGKLVTEYSAQTLGASVDSVKDPSFETFNGNTYTYGMTGAMLAVGINMNIAAYYSRQPIVKQITEKYFRNKGITSTQEGGERFEVRERYIKELLGNEYNKVQFNTTAKNELLVQRGVNIGEFTPFSEAELLNNIKTSIEIGSISNMKDKNFIIDQLNIFENFMKLRQAGEAFDDLIRATKPEATGAGPSMTVTEELNAAQAKTYNYQGEEGPISRIVDKDGRDAIDLIYSPENAPMKVIPNMYKYSNGASIKLLTSQFPQYSPTISYLVEEINELIGKDYKSDRAKLIHNFVFAKLKHNNIDFVRNGRPYAEILGFTTEESTASKVAKLKEKYPKIDSEQTELLGYLYPKVSKEDVAKNNGAQLIDVKYPADISTELEDSFHDMYHGRVPGLTAEQQQEFKDLARELILYSFHTTGLRAGRNSFAGLIIPSILNSPEIRFGDTMNEVAQAINNNSRQTLAVGEAIFEFFQHNAYNRDIVPVGKKQWKTNSKGEFFIAKNSPRWEAQSDGLIVEDIDKITKAGLINSPFVVVPKYKDGKIESEILYFKAGTSENDMVYVPVPKLGIRGKALNLSNEYMAHEDVYANIEEYDSINEAVEYAQLEYGAEKMVNMKELFSSIAEITRTKQSGC